jgi:hypothetical protein
MITFSHAGLLRNWDVEENHGVGCEAPSTMSRWNEEPHARSTPGSSSVVQKEFICPVMVNIGTIVRVCEKRFLRQEHYRRHMKTLHSERREICKVPGCGKKFPRFDNLQDHYWTHLDKGVGGRRVTLTLEALRDVLPLNERKICPRLEMRLHKFRMSNKGGNRGRARRR